MVIALTRLVISTGYVITCFAISNLTGILTARHYAGQRMASAHLGTSPPLIRDVLVE